MEKMSKGELQACAGMFAHHICHGMGNPQHPEIKFSHHDFNGGMLMTADELATRLNTMDPELAKRFRAWYDATMALGTHIHDRIETPGR